MDTEQEQNRDQYKDQMESQVPYRNVHTDPRQKQGPGRIVSYCASPVPCTGAGRIHVQCGCTIRHMEPTVCTCVSEISTLNMVGKPLVVTG